MARTVFFSFHYQEDDWRVWEVRQHNQFKEVAGDINNAKLFLNRDNWESVKSYGDANIKRVINEGMKYTGVTVVLIGQYTWQRKYVRYEIEKSERDNKGMIGVRIHGLRNRQRELGVWGYSPFEYVPLRKTYPVYDWIADRGYDNFSDWVEQAAVDAGR